jgi:hypothetical protein
MSFPFRRFSTCNNCGHPIKRLNKYWFHYKKTSLCSDCSRLYKGCKCHDPKPKQLSLVDYLLLSLIHLIPIELLFSYLAHTMPLWESSLVFIDIMYFIIVGVIGIKHNRKKVMKSILDAVEKNIIAKYNLEPVINAAERVKPYLDAIDKNKDKLKIEPDDFINLLEKVKNFSENGEQDKAEKVIVSSQSMDETIKEMQVQSKKISP